MVKAKACQPETLRARRREVEREPQELEYARLRAEDGKTNRRVLRLKMRLECYDGGVMK